MVKKQKSKSPFEGCKITVIIGDDNWEWGGGKGPTRAVVELESDIEYAMPSLSRVIEGCAYNPNGHTMGFRHEDMAVIVESQQITIIGAQDEEMAGRVIDWLTNAIDGTMKATWRKVDYDGRRTAISGPIVWGTQ